MHLTQCIFAPFSKTPSLAFVLSIYAILRQQALYGALRTLKHEWNLLESRAKRSEARVPAMFMSALKSAKVPYKAVDEDNVCSLTYRS